LIGGTMYKQAPMRKEKTGKEDADSPDDTEKLLPDGKENTEAV